jgi:putative membrane protein
MISCLVLFTSAAVAQGVDQPAHKSPAPGSNSETMSAAKDATAGMVGTVSAEMTTTTKGFVTAAATSDMYEVAAATVAVERSPSADVKDFAQKMLTAHNKTTAQLKGIIASNNIKVTPPATVDSRRQGMLDDLRGAKGADFDHRYAAQQVAAHKEADILFSGYAKSGDNAAIKQFAATTDPVIKDHLAMAQTLATAHK